MGEVGEEEVVVVEVVGVVVEVVGSTTISPPHEMLLDLALRLYSCARRKMCECRQCRPVGLER